MKYTARREPMLIDRMKQVCQETPMESCRFSANVRVIEDDVLVPLACRMGGV